MQNWFSGGVSDNGNSPQPTTVPASSSLLADWNSYAAARSSEETNSSGSLAGVFDIEAAVRSANDTVSGTFNVGPKNQFYHMSSKERLPFTLGFIGSMMGTIYVSMVLHSYILSVLFSVVQVMALAYYAISYFPGGSAGLKFLSSSLTTSIMKCFGR